VYDSDALYLANWRGNPESH